MAGGVLDDLDRRLLHHLQGDARLSHRELARRTGATAPTVSARLRRMERLGVILGYTVRLDPARFPHQGEPVDISRTASLDCHWCGGATTRPVWATLAGTPHPFCCRNCRDDYTDKHRRLSRNA